MKNILDLKWKEIEDLDKEKTVLFLTVAPVEEHGLHMPVSIDIDLGEYWQHLAITKLEERLPEFRFCSLPFLPVAQGGMKNFPGCIYVKARLLRRLLTQYLAGIAGWGIRYLIVLASHGDPLHNMAIEKACAKTNRRFGTKFISPLGAMFSYTELGIDLKFPAQVQNMIAQHPNDFHAGWIETSMMLAIAPEKVDPQFRNMEDVQVNERDMMSPKKYLNATAEKGHLGYPRLADSESGRMINESTANYLADVSEKLVRNKEVGRFSHHFLNRIPFLRMLV
ncbi:MAG: creatininase family protein [Spirochaetales bacterium]|nr:creatininase family protein [Spirochaetales bacterium]